jgi:hypothetical protein
MKPGRFIFKALLIVSAITIGLASCRKDKEPVYDYFMSGEFAVNYRMASYICLPSGTM